MKKLNETNNEKISALIYCRVSTVRQEVDGGGLGSQEHRCRQYCEDRNYTVVKVFSDTFTGGGDFMARPKMRELLEYVDKNPKNGYVVVFDDLKRFARDLEFHLKLRAEFKIRNLKMECLNFSFQDGPEGTFSENLMAIVNQFEREQNKRQVFQKTKARLESGYWTFFRPPGYRHKKSERNGKVLVVDQKEAHVIKEALEGFASNRFPEIVDVYKFLIRVEFIKNNEKNHIQRARDLLDRAFFYAGYIEYKKWDVSRVRGQHAAIISEECLHKIENKLNKKPISALRKDKNEDFSLRGFIACIECGGAMTGSWSTGRNGKYAYYRCNKNGCTLKNKSIKRGEAEARFETLLKTLSPKPSLLDFALAKLLERFIRAKKEINKIKEKAEVRIQENKEKIKKFATLIVNASDPSVIKAYEDAISELRLSQDDDIDKINQIVDGKIDFGTAINNVFGVLKNPHIEWKNGDLKHKDLVKKMIFSEKPRYDQKNGFGTAKYSLPMKIFENISDSNSSVVEMTREFHYSFHVVKLRFQNPRF